MGLVGRKFCGLLEFVGDVYFVVVIVVFLGEYLVWVVVLECGEDFV